MLAVAVPLEKTLGARTALGVLPLKRLTANCGVKGRMIPDYEASAEVFEHRRHGWAHGSERPHGDDAFTASYRLTYRTL
jgi:hypothetical protein